MKQVQESNMSVYNYIPKPGSILVGDGHGFTSWLQHTVNGKGATHGCHISYPDGSKKDMPLVLSAEYNGVVHEWWHKFVSDNTYNFWLYEVVEATQEEINWALDYCEREFLNDKYAYLSWPWFGWCALWKKVLNPLGVFLHLWYYNIDKEHNWYFKDCFCTEQEWHFMKQLIVENFGTRSREKVFLGKTWADKLYELLFNYFPDTFQPIQLKMLLNTNPDIFKLVAQRVDGVFTSFE
jgi:hypothetical protein